MGDPAHRGLLSRAWPPFIPFPCVTRRWRGTHLPTGPLGDELCRIRFVGPPVESKGVQHDEEVPRFPQAPPRTTSRHGGNSAFLTRWAGGVRGQRRRRRSRGAQGRPPRRMAVGRRVAGARAAGGIGRRLGCGNRRAPGTGSVSIHAGAPRHRPRCVPVTGRTGSSPLGARRAECLT